MERLPANHPEPRTGGDRRVTADPTRARILAAALDAFAAHGFHGTSTRMIAAGAGISAGAVYVHHRSKEELLFQLSVSGHREALEAVLAAREGAVEPAEQLRSIMREFTIWHARRHKVARVVQYELGALNEAHYEKVADLRRGTRGVVRVVIEAGTVAGEFHVEDPDLTTVALLSLGIDVARWFRPGVWTPEAIGERYATLAMLMVNQSAK